MILPCDVSNVLLWALMRAPAAAAGPMPRACLGASPAHPAPGADLLAACPPQLLPLHCGAWLLDVRFFLLKAFAHFMGIFERFSTCVVILWVLLCFYSSGHVMGLSARFFSTCRTRAARTCTPASASGCFTNPWQMSSVSPRVTACAPGTMRFEMTTERIAPGLQCCNDVAL